MDIFYDRYCYKLFGGDPMFNSNHEKYDNTMTGRSPAVIGAVSAAAGIALGATAAVYLSKKDNRKKLMDSLEVVRGKAKTAIKSFVMKAEDSTNTVKQNVKNSRASRTLSL